MDKGNSSQYCLKEVNKQKYLIPTVGYVIGIVLLLFKIFDVSTLVYMSLIIISVLILGLLVVYDVISQGIISFLPSRVRYLLLRKSIFDILMDIWYLPSITLYIKVLTKPFIYHISPEEATGILNEFDPIVREKFLTKVKKGFYIGVS